MEGNTKKQEYEKASVLERIIAMVPLALNTFAFIVADGTANLSIREKKCKYYEKIRDEASEQIKESGRLVFLGEKPKYYQ